MTWARFSSSPIATRPRVSAMRPGRPTSPSRRGEPQPRWHRAGPAVGSHEARFAGAGRRGRLRRSGPEHRLELGRHRRRPAGRRCTTRAAVGAPAAERGGMAEPVALQVVVGDLARPGRVAAAPSRGPCPRSSATGAPGLRAGPAVSCSAAHAAQGWPSGGSARRYGVELLHQLASARRGERGRHPHVVQHAVVVEQARAAVIRSRRRTCATGIRPRRSRRCARA